MPTTIAKWERDTTGLKTNIVLPALANPHGKHVQCLNGCGNVVSENVRVCRACRRKAKLVKAHEAYKTRKAQALVNKSKEE